MGRRPAPRPWSRRVAKSDRVAMRRISVLLGERPIRCEFRRDWRREQLAERITAAQRYVCRRRDREGKPNYYYWIALWWELEAKRGYNHKPIDCHLTSAELSLCYAESQKMLFWDMKNRPEHYACKPTYDRRGNRISDWQWSGLKGWEEREHDAKRDKGHAGGAGREHGHVRREVRTLRTDG